MRSLADSRKAWEGSSVHTTFTANCACGAEGYIQGIDIEFESLRRKLSVGGWRFNDAGDRCICPKCGPKKYPELYVPNSHYKAKPDGSVSNSPRVVRRVGQSGRKQAEKKVLAPRRIRKL